MGVVGAVGAVFILLLCVITLMLAVLIAVRSKHQEMQRRSKRQEEIQRYEKISLEKLQLHTNFIEKALPQLSDFEVLQCFLDFLHTILLKGLKDETIRPEITEVVKKALLADKKALLADGSCSTSV